MMNRSFIFKVVGIFLLTVLMSWAVSYVNGIILERQQRQVEVKSDIARSSAGEQTIVGPVLVVPYIEDFLETTTENNVKKVEAKSEQYFAFILPENLEASGGFTNEYKQLGIYKALMYQLSGSVKGTFKIPANFNIHSTHNNGSVRLSPAYISLGISDPRGITTKPVFNWGNQTLPFAQGSRVKSLGNGIHVV
jgi:inner membrane protein